MHGCVQQHEMCDIAQSMNYDRVKQPCALGSGLSHYQEILSSFHFGLLSR